MKREGRGLKTTSQKDWKKIKRKKINGGRGCLMWKTEGKGCPHLSWGSPSGVLSIITGGEKCWRQKRFEKKNQGILTARKRSACGPTSTLLRQSRKTQQREKSCRKGKSKWNGLSLGRSTTRSMKKAKRKKASV